MKRRIAVLVMAGAVAVCAYFFYFRPRWIDEKSQPNLLYLSGNIEAHESTVGFKVSGRIVDLPIEEGQWVEPGTVLASWIPLTTVSSWPWTGPRSLISELDWSFAVFRNKASRIQMTTKQQTESTAIPTRKTSPSIDNPAEGGT